MAVTITVGGGTALAFAGQKQAKPKTGKGQFKPGESGNPAGKKPGTLNRTTLLAQQLLDGEAEEIMRGLIEDAKRGDDTARRLLVPRMLPTRRSREINFKLPDAQTAEGVAAALDAVLAAVGDGDVALDEAEAPSGLLQARLRAIETVDLERRLAALEVAPEGSRS